MNETSSNEIKEQSEINIPTETSVQNEVKLPRELKTEETYDPRHKREIIKNIIIVFLAVLLVLTFCSNTIMNRSLPEITTERTSSGKLTERLRGSGLVMSNQTYEVTLTGNHTVDTIMVKNGKEVKKDDVLFTVGKGENAELTTAEEALAAMELEYQKALLAMPADYSSENQAIANARADLQAAITKRDNAAASQGDQQAAKDAYNSNKSELNYYTREQAKLQATISAIDSDEYSGAAPEYTGDLIRLKSDFENASADYNAAFGLYTQLVSGGNDEESSGGASQDMIDSAKADADAKEEVRDEARDAYEDAKYDLRNWLLSELSSAEDNVNYYTDLVNSYESSQTTGFSDLDMLEEDVKAKQRTLDDLITALNKTKASNDNESKISNLDLEAKKKEIEKQKSKIAKIKETSDITEVKSKYSGVVSSVNIKPGDETVPDTPLIEIDLADEGYTVQVSVPSDKAMKVKKGTAAEIVNNWNGKAEAVLTDIKNDTTANSRNKLLTFSITGDVTSGSFLDLSIPCGGGNFDAIVPKSAVRQDTDGFFVLTVRSKSSPLGNRYYAEKVAVEVLASDEVSSAVSGNVMNGDYVITASSKSIAPGDQVRIKDK